MELAVLEWVRELLGFPVGTEGVVLSGGSLANMTALAAARVAVGPGAAYVSDQGHSSLARGLSTLGFADADIRILPTDEAFWLTAATVADAVNTDRARGIQPRFVIASAGTTNTGAVDELGGIAELCASEGLWFHVDDAYGGSAALCEGGRATLAGIEKADSLVLDPHKWLFAPYDAGILLTRHPGVLDRAFSMRPEYLADVQSDSGEVDFGNRSPELTRRARTKALDDLPHLWRQ